MFSHLLVISLALPSLANQPSPIPPRQDLVVTESRIRSDSWIGSCVSGGRSFDLSRALMISNRVANIGSASEPVMARVDREAVEIIDGDGASRSRGIVDVSRIASADTDIDISLNFIILDGKISVYWKETYLNRRYRQGVVNLSRDGDVSIICEGVGGVDRSH